MQTYEFPARIDAAGKLELPNAVLPQSFNNQSVRVIVLLGEADGMVEQNQWQEFSTDQFLAGYSAVDAIYDET